MCAAAAAILATATLVRAQSSAKTGGGPKFEVASIRRSAANAVGPGAPKGGGWPLQHGSHRFEPGAGVPQPVWNDFGIVPPIRTVGCQIQNHGRFATYAGPQGTVPGLDQLNLLLPYVPGAGETDLACQFSADSETAYSTAVKINIQ